MPAFPRRDARRCCQETEDRGNGIASGYNRRGSKDSQLR